MRAPKLDDPEELREWSERLDREFERTQRVPGIWFMDSASGRVACLRGTGVKVWLAIQIFKDMDEDRGDFAAWFSWLTWDQLQPAFDYYAAYPEEIDEMIAENDKWDEEQIAQFNAETQARVAARNR